MEKKYKITDCKKYYNGASLAYLGSASLWFTTLFTPSNYDQFIALIAGVTCSFIKTKYEVKMLHSYEVTKLQEIYRNILDKYLEVNHIFNFTNPLEIFTLFNYAINNNLFSINTKKDMVYSRRFDTLLMRELTLNNHGVCRHISTMLTDVYKELGIQSEVGICLRPQMREVTKPLDDTDKEIIEQMTKEIKKIAQIEINGKPIPFDNLIELPAQKIVYEEVPFTKDELKNGNHAITLATDEEYTYYLDALNSNIFTNTNTENELVSEDGVIIKMMPKIGELMNKNWKIETGELKQPAPMNYMLETLSKTEFIIADNEDIIEKYKKEIKEELEEAEEMHRLILK